jgi:hypothetical protein
VYHVTPLQNRLQQQQPNALPEVSEVFGNMAQSGQTFWTKHAWSLAKPNTLTEGCLHFHLVGRFSTEPGHPAALCSKHQRNFAYVTRSARASFSFLLTSLI